ncbi:MAG: hypothetical protein AAGC96_07350, partial [Pseudomonadota bacterium]
QVVNKRTERCSLEFKTLLFGQFGHFLLQAMLFGSVQHLVCVAINFHGPGSAAPSLYIQRYGFR